MVLEVWLGGIGGTGAERNFLMSHFRIPGDQLAVMFLVQNLSP
jgi:hypothetical protein